MKPNPLLAHLKAMAKKSPLFYVHFARAFDAPSWDDRGTFTLSARNGTGHDGPVTKLDVPGTCGNGSTDAKESHTYDGRTWDTYSEHYRPTHGFWSFSGDTLRDVLLLLPSDAEVSFRVILDYGNNQNVIDATLHSDHIYLVARMQRGTRAVERRFLLDVSTGKHNTARFGVAS